MLLSDAIFFATFLSTVSGFASHLQCVCPNSEADRNNRKLEVEAARGDSDSTICQRLCLLARGDSSSVRSKRQAVYGYPQGYVQPPQPQFLIPYYQYQPPRPSPPQFATRRRYSVRYKYDCLEECAPRCAWDCKRGVDVGHRFHSVPLSLASRIGIDTTRVAVGDLTPDTARQIERGRLARHPIVFGELPAGRPRGLPPIPPLPNAYPRPASTGGNYPLPQGRNTAVFVKPSGSSGSATGSIIQPVAVQKVAKRVQAAVPKPKQPELPEKYGENRTIPVYSTTTTTPATYVTPNTTGTIQRFSEEALREPELSYQKKPKTKQGEYLKKSRKSSSSYEKQNYNSNVPAAFRSARRNYRLPNSSPNPAKPLSRKPSTTTKKSYKSEQATTSPSIVHYVSAQFDLKLPQATPATVYRSKTQSSTNSSYPQPTTTPSLYGIAVTGKDTGPIRFNSYPVARPQQRAQRPLPIASGRSSLGFRANPPRRTVYARNPFTQGPQRPPLRWGRTRIEVAGPGRGNYVAFSG